MEFNVFAMRDSSILMENVSNSHLKKAINKIITIQHPHQHHLLQAQQTLVKMANTMMLVNQNVCHVFKVAVNVLMHNNAKHAQQDLCLLILKHVNKFVEMD
jgi:hypothetical protein